MADKILNVGDLADVQEELHGTESKWKKIGIQLKLDPIQCLKKIEKEKKGDPEECSIEMQIEWLSSKKATWKSLVEALRKTSVGFEEKAKAIEKKKLFSDNTGNSAVLLEVTFQYCDLSAGGCSSSSSCIELPQNTFLTEHLEWLLKIGCSLDKIVEWVQKKQQSQTVEASMPHQSNSNGIDDDSHTNDIICGSWHESEEHVEVPSEQQSSLSHTVSGR